jgi:hypothetical protein
VKARNQAADTINELEEIINELIADKSELARIAKEYEDELVAQRLSEDDVAYITSKLLPLIEGLIPASSPGGSQGTAARAQLEALKALLSTETVTILQLLGFNFREAIGGPLTTLVSDFILSKAPTGTRGPAIGAQKRK